MGMMNLQQALDFICQSVPHARLVGDGATPVARVHTDTRTLQPGDLFVALKGERFDANAFLSDARDAGAVAALAHGGLEAAGLPGIEVPDSLAALGAQRRALRPQPQHRGAPRQRPDLACGQQQPAPLQRACLQS